MTRIKKNCENHLTSAEYLIIIFKKKGDFLLAKLLDKLSENSK